MKFAAKKNVPFSLAILDGHMPQTDGFSLASRLNRSRTLSKTKIIMLTSAVDQADFERCRKIHVATQLNKPVKQSELLDAIVRLFSGTVPAHKKRRTAHPSESSADAKRKRDSAQPQDAKRKRDSAQPQERLRILVAEDNPVNQKLMSELLKRRGYTV